MNDFKLKCIFIVAYSLILNPYETLTKAYKFITVIYSNATYATTQKVKKMLSHFIPYCFLERNQKPNNNIYYSSLYKHPSRSEEQILDSSFRYI